MISTKGRYALRLMIDLAEQNSSEYVPLKSIAGRQKISEKYLQQIAKQLVEKEMLAGISGKGGGYKLTRKPEEYSVGEILELMEGTLSPVACLASGAEECTERAVCRTLPMWRRFDRLVRDFFFNITLAEFL